MKYIICILGLIISVSPVYATTMCAATDTVGVILDPSVGGNSYTYDNTAGTWRTVFSYGAISGVSACLSSAYGKSRGGYVENLKDNDQSVVGGERNGQYCWCKMTHPAASAWVFGYAYGSASGCASYCTDYCGNNAQYYADLRGGLFGSVVQ